MAFSLQPRHWAASLPVALEGAGFAIPISIGSVGLLYSHIHIQWIFPGVVAALLGMLLMHLAGAQSTRPMVYAVRIMEVATLINFLDIFVEKMPAWGLADSPSHRLMLVMLVCMGVALLLPLCHALQFARFARLIPLPVFAGFGNAICLTILLTQSKVLGALMVQSEWAICGLVLAAVGTAIATQHFFKRVPAGIAGLVVGSLVAVLLLTLGHDALPMIGSANSAFNLPVLLVPWRDLLSAGVDLGAIVRNVAFASAMVTLVAFLNTVIAEAFVTQMDGKRAQATNWMPLSAAQFASIALGCTPLTPSISATRGAAAAGALTPAALALLGLVCVAVYASAVLSVLPVAAISGALLFDAWCNANRPSLHLTWQYIARRSTVKPVQKEDLLMVWLVVAAAVLYNMIFGVLVGILGGLVLYAIRNGRRMVRSIRTGENLHSNCVWSAAESELLRAQGKNTHLVALDGALFFGVADQLESILKDELRQCRRLILDWSLVTSLDSAVAMATRNVLLAAQVLGVKVVFCGLEAAGADVAGALEVSLSLPIKFPDADRALEWAEMDILQADSYGGAAPEPLGLQALATLLGLAESDRQPLMGILELRSYQQGQTIFQRGDSGAEMVFILQGGADVRIPGFNGRDVRVALYRQGSMVGEMGFLDGQPRSATVTAVSDLSVAVLHRSAFDSFAANYPAGSRQILMHLAMELNSRLRRTNRIL